MVTSAEARDRRVAAGRAVRRRCSRGRPRTGRPRARHAARRHRAAAGRDSSKTTDQTSTFRIAPSSQSRATVIWCTSSGPSAMRARAREPGHQRENRQVFAEPLAPCASEWASSSTLHSNACATLHLRHRRVGRLLRLARSPTSTRSGTSSGSRREWRRRSRRASPARLLVARELLAERQRAS